MFLVLICVLIALSAGNHISESDSIKEYCQKETFQPRCWKNEVILMKSATYGRMGVGRCLTVEEEELSLMSNNPRYLGCSIDVLHLIDSRCSGKASCDVSVLDDELQKVNPCFKGLVSYMVVAYTCVPVIIEASDCHILVHSATPTHILSSFTNFQKCLPPSKPLVIEAPAGQKIQIGLVNLNNTAWNVYCPFGIGFVNDKKAGKKREFCIDNNLRYKDLYISLHNKLELIIEVDKMVGLKMNQSSEIFFLKIEAVGCSDLIPAEDAWLKRNNDEATIGCYSSRQTWQLKCRVNQWVGALGNCSNGGSQNNQAHFPPMHAEVLSENLSDRNLELLGIIAISGVGLAVCSLIIGIGYLCSKRYNTKALKAVQNQMYNECHSVTNPSDVSYYNKQLLQSEDNVNMNSYEDAAYFVLDENSVKEEKAMECTLK